MCDGNPLEDFELGWDATFLKILSAVLVRDCGAGARGGRWPTRRLPQKTRWGILVGLGGEGWLNYKYILKVDHVGCACELDVGGHPSCVHSLWPRTALLSLDSHLAAVTLGTVMRYKHNSIPSASAL